MKDGTDSSVENGRSQGIEGIGTKGDGGFHGVGGLSCHMSVFIDTIFDKRDMYNNLSMHHLMPVPHQFPLHSPSKTSLTQKVADQDFGRVTVERGVDVESGFDVESSVDVERRVAGFSLINASGGGIGDVPTGRPTEDLVGRLSLIHI